MNAHATIFGQGDAAVAGGKIEISRPDGPAERMAAIHRQAVTQSADQAREMRCNADMHVRALEADLAEARQVFERERERIEREISATRRNAAVHIEERERILRAHKAALEILETQPRTAPTDPAFV